MYAQRPMSLDDWFVPFPTAHRDAALEAYAAHLAARDGGPHAAKRLLPHREAALDRLLQESGRFRGRIDPAVFAAHMHAASGPQSAAPAHLPRELLFVYTCVRINTYEAYSIEQLMASRTSMPQDTLRERINLIIMLEEDYHSRFLGTIADVFALPLTAPPPPPLAVRSLIAGLGHLPQWLAHPLTLCSEIIGLALFVKLLELAGTIFAAEPAIREALGIRLGEVIADELGHISYNRLSLSPTGLALARRMLPLVAYGTRYGMPGAADLGLYPIPFTAIQELRLERLPPGILQQAFLV